MSENIEATRAASETAEAQAAALAFTPAAAAAAIVAYYPELVDLDTSTQTAVKDHIRKASGFEQFVQSISPDAPMDEGVAVSVSIYTRDKWLCGSGQTTATISKATRSPTFELGLNISEYRVPLSADTQYGHKRKLVYDTASQRHVWQMGPAPGAVWSGSNGCAGSGNVLCQLTGITLNEKARTLGYGWRHPGRASRLAASLPPPVASCTHSKTLACQTRRRRSSSPPAVSFFRRASSISAPARTTSQRTVTSTTSTWTRRPSRPAPPISCGA